MLKRILADVQSALADASNHLNDGRYDEDELPKWLTDQLDALDRAIDGAATTVNLILDRIEKESQS